MQLNNKIVLALAASGFLFFAQMDGLPYGYFTLMRFVVTAVSLYLVYNIYQENKESLWIWAFGLIAVLFNPIIPVFLERSQWKIIDLIVGMFFVISIFLIRKGKKS